VKVLQRLVIPINIVGERDGYNKINVLGIGKYDSLGVNRGVVANIGLTTTAIKKAVEMASRICNAEIAEVYVGIAGQHIKSFQKVGNIVRPHPREEVSKKDIDRLINDIRNLVIVPGEEVIDIIPQEYTVDKETDITHPIGMAGVYLGGNFHIITGSMSSIQNINRCVTNAGLITQKLILEPIASSKAVLHEDEMEAGVALVDIGGGTTDVAIFHKGIIRHTAVIPLAGNIITNQIGLNHALFLLYFN
jgi:cell division protein FtsA